ncbi:hypothetical protein DER45DRAFT_576841 [Fusarium avenaceum]|nr:hypothetical protein DER45DRAFT_576841 [Fusarium avenaceum]
MPLDPSGETIIATQWTLIFIATGVIVARLYLRLILQKRRLLISDLFMCAGWCSAVALASFDIVFYRMGVLRQGVTLGLVGFEGTAEEAERFYKLNYIANYPFFTTFYLAKAALLAVYHQVFPTFMVKRRRFLWATVIYVALSFVISMLLLSVTCLPIWRNWNLSDNMCSIKHMKINFEIAWSLNIIGDLLIFILPWLVIPELTLRKKLRYSLYATFLLGLINIIFSLVRFAQIEEYGKDLVITVALIDLWSFIDACIGLIIACLPSLRPFFKWKEKVKYYGHDSELGNKSTGSDQTSHKPILASDPEMLAQPSNVHLSLETQRKSSALSNEKL